MNNALTPLGVVTRPTQHIFLSPHYDDIALSCGGTARLASRAGNRPLVALIFGSEPDHTRPMTDFAETSHRKWGLETGSVVASRRAEEAAAAAILGVDVRFLPFQDAVYRGEQYTSNDQLFGIPAPSDATLPARIVDELGLGGLATTHARIYVPLGSGNHVDHQLAFEAGRELANAGWDVWFYEDLPYSLDAERLAARLNALDGQVEVAALVDVSNVWRDKLSAILAYPSQLQGAFSFVNVGHSAEGIDAAMSAYADALLPGHRVERFWKLA